MLVRPLRYEGNPLHLPSTNARAVVPVDASTWTSHLGAYHAARLATQGAIGGVRSAGATAKSAAVVSQTLSKPQERLVLRPEKLQELYAILRTALGQVLRPSLMR